MSAEAGVIGTRRSGYEEVGSELDTGDASRRPHAMCGAKGGGKNLTPFDGRELASMYWNARPRNRARGRDPSP